MYYIELGLGSVQGMFMRRALKDYVRCGQIVDGGVNEQVS